MAEGGGRSRENKDMHEITYHVETDCLNISHMLLVYVIRHRFISIS